jgi:hypothetical protein
VFIDRSDLEEALMLLPYSYVVLLMPQLTTWIEVRSALLKYLDLSFVLIIFISIFYFQSNSMLHMFLTAGAFISV